MSVPNVVWFRPVRFSSAAYTISATINSVTETLNFPTLTVGRDYWVTGDAQADALETDSDIGKADLARLLRTCLRTHTHGAAVEVTLSTSTWKLTITAPTAIQIRWSNVNTTIDETIFGWTTDSAAATSITSMQEVIGPIVFGRPVTVDSRDRQSIVGGISSSLSGKVRVSRLSLPKKERDFVVRFIEQANALREYETTLTSVERGWVDALSLGYPFRHYEQVSDIASTTYSVYRLRDLEYPLERNEQFRVWWDATFRARLEVA